ncbi:MAG TPA: hypothetical protein VHM19_06180 [Polyangiales bacterium]|jgi:hypothetical protein|nr:hypothetical protein [Polyangiales bacterium]
MSAELVTNFDEARAALLARRDALIEELRGLPARRLALRDEIATLDAALGSRRAPRDSIIPSATRILAQGPMLLNRLAEIVAAEVGATVNSVKSNVCRAKRAGKFCHDPKTGRYSLPVGSDHA